MAFHIFFLNNILASIHIMDKWLGPNMKNQKAYKAENCDEQKFAEWSRLFSREFQMLTTQKNLSHSPKVSVNKSSAELKTVRHTGKRVKTMNQMI
jgi:hypothetical protein